ncbi:lipid-A-disaccharide synthase N-terminal domain-containing protein [Paludisphaera mucosa]|uniref:Lipid-A-disaccharide synthase N-terminal domain-containing protein n=1 Tax=Paludisphaera mucosa TaxID=3030827 RepID=A0ABT6FBF4_9BACT|nr:lipid-A-disaccharide synthase N-terminal domain-containing protein [Paludisphaera mucosa]MDG3004923.1 lipid-A-disaccharide synthase N-terminal domain-containing protein [Paludisphaera mucosa]
MWDPRYWLVVGFVGQGLFTARFVVQWLASERSGAVVVPAAFWWLSILGGFALLSYAIARRDPVFAVGQSMGVFVYVRNLMIQSGKGSTPPRAAGASTTPAPHFRAEAVEPAAARA